MSIAKKTLWICIGLLLFGSIAVIAFLPEVKEAVSALTDSKTFDRETNTITILDGMLGEPLAEYTLIENTDFCLTKCHAIGNLKLHTQGKLFSDINFKDVLGSSKTLEHKITYAESKTYFIEVDDYETVCEDFEYPNKSIYEVCNEVKTGSHTEEKTRWDWHDYKGEILEAGNYQWKIEGTKEDKENIDWLVTAFGEEFKEWSWWTGDNCGYMTSYFIEPTISDSNFQLRILTDTTGGHWNDNVGKIYVIDNRTDDILAWYNTTSFNNANTVIFTNTSVIGGTDFGIEIYYSCGDNVPNRNNVSEVMLKSFVFDTAAEIASFWATNSLLNTTTQKEGLGMLSYDGSGDMGCWNNTPDYRNITFVGWMWVEPSDSNVAEVIGLDPSFSGYMIIKHQTSYSTVNFTVQIGAGGDTVVSKTPLTTGWTEFQFDVNGESNQTIWINGIYCCNGTKTGGLVQRVAAQVYDTTQHKGFDLYYFYRNYFHNNPTITDLGEQTKPNIAPVVSNQFPANSTTYYFDSANFTFNVTDPDADTITNCSLYINDVKIDTDESITQTINQTINRTSLSAGQHLWKIGCWDEHHIQGNSSEFNLTTIIDSPRIYNVFPTNNTQSYSLSANFTFNVTTTSHSITSCDLFINGALNTTDNSITQDINQSINLTTLSYGDSVWLIQCTSSEGLKANSSAWNYSRQIAYPIIRNQFPTNNTLSYSPYANFTFNTSIDYGTIDKCSLFINDVLNETDNTVTEIVNQTFNLSTLPYGDSIWLIECKSNFGIKYNSSEYNYSRERAYPTLTFVSPANNTNNYSPYENFTYQVTIPYGSITECYSFFSPHVLNDTDSNIEEGVDQTFNVTTLPYDDTLWKIECISNFKIRANLSEYNRSRKRAYPDIDLQYPSDDTLSYSPYANFTYNTSIPYGSVDECYLWLDSKGTFVLNATDSNIEKTVNQTFNLTTLPYNDTSWKVECKSNFGIKQNSSAWNYSRQIAYPVVNLQFPPEDYIYPTYHVNLTYNVSVPYGSISLCFLWLNDLPLGEDTTITQTINQTFNLTLPILHYYNWSVQCRSNFGINTRSSLYNFTKNVPPTTPPIISPVNNTFTLLNSQILSCSGSTDIEDDVNYEFYGGTDKTNLSLLQNSSSTTYTYSNLKPRYYFWRCRSNDNMSNSAWIGIRRFSYAQIYGNCSAAVNSTTAIAYNFSFAEETNLTRLYNVSFESTFNLWGTNSSINFTTTVETAKNEVLFCISPKNATFYGNAMIEYVSPTYDIRNYYLRNATFNETTEHVTLYSLPITLASGIGITITDEIDDPLEDVYIDIERYYVGENTYRTIAMGRTDDIGKDYVYLRKYDAWYRFTMRKDGVILFISEQMKIDADTLSLKIGETIISDLLEDFDEISYNLSYNNVTKVFSVIWTDSAANTNYGCLSVVDRDPAGDTWVCHDCLTASSGTLTCDVSTYATGNHTLIATFYVNMNPLKTIATMIISRATGRLADLIGLDGVVVTLFITGTAAFAALWWSPAAVIILGIIGFISSIWIQTINVTYGAALAIIIAGIIIMVQQSKGRS